MSFSAWANAAPSRRAAALLVVPWNAFVASFLYYVLLAALAFGGLSAPVAVVVGAYAAPPLAWLATVAVRLGGVLAAGGRRGSRSPSGPPRRVEDPCLCAGD